MTIQDEWVVTASYEIDPSTDAMDEWSERLDATVSRVPDRGLVNVTVYAAGDLHLVDIMAKVVDPVNEIVHAEPAGVEVVRESEWQRRAEAPTLPELMSAAEIAEELGVARQRVHQLRSTAAFPAPLVELRGGAVWDARAVRKFAEEWDRKPGRPVLFSVRYEQVLGAGDPMSSEFGPLTESRARQFFEQAIKNPTMQKIRLLRGSGAAEVTVDSHD
jgi:hypothetical protein